MLGDGHVGSTAMIHIWVKSILEVAVVVKLFTNINWQEIEREGYENRGLQQPDHDRSLFVPAEQ